MARKATATTTRTNEDQAILESLLGSDALDEIIESALPDDEIPDDLSDLELQMTTTPEAEDVITTIYEAQENTDGELEEAAVTEEKSKKERKAKATRPSPLRDAAAKKSEKATHILGDKIGEFLVLESADLDLDEETLKAKQAKILSMLDAKPGEEGVARKVGEKALMLFKWLKSGGPISNEVMRRTFEVLKRDGYLTSGDKGNLQVNLLEKYSVGTARSQANQMFMLLPFLKVTVKTKGRMEPNPDSTIWMRYESM